MPIKRNILSLVKHIYWFNSYWSIDYPLLIANRLYYFNLEEKINLLKPDVIGTLYEDKIEFYQLGLAAAEYAGEDLYNLFSLSISDILSHYKRDCPIKCSKVNPFTDNIFESSLCYAFAIEVITRSGVEDKQKVITWLIRRAKHSTIRKTDRWWIYEEYPRSDGDIIGVLNGHLSFIISLITDYERSHPDRFYELEREFENICALLPMYTKKFWTSYSLNGEYASRNYHKIHIKQILYLMSFAKRKGLPCDGFDKFVNDASFQDRNLIYRLISLLVKVGGYVRR